MTQPQSTDASVTVVDVPERSRFEVSVDGTLAGVAEYVDDAPGERTFPHTVVEEQFEGRGLATLLIRTALDAARVAELAVVPQCSAFRHFLGKHPEYVDLVPAERRAELGL